MRVATAWFETEQHDDDLVLVTEPHVSPLVSANTWWLRGRLTDLVIDTGLGVASLREHLPAMFDREPLAVVTHTHLDHVGGAHEFGGIAVHDAEAMAAVSPGRASLDPATELEILGMQIEETTVLPPSFLRALPATDYEPRDYVVRPANVARRLREGDLLEVGDVAMRVLHLPGHSPGSIALWDEGRARLFSGDVVYDDELLDQLDGADIEAYVESMRRLLDLPVETVYPGHGPPFTGARLREIASDYISRRAAH